MKNWKYRIKNYPLLFMLVIMFWIASFFFRIGELGVSDSEIMQPTKYEHYTYSTYQDLAVDYPEYAVEAQKAYDFVNDLKVQYQQYYPNDSSIMDEQYTIINDEIDYMTIRSNFENKSIEDEIAVHYYKHNDSYELQVASDWEVTPESFNLKETKDVEVIAKLSGIEKKTLEKITLDFMEEIPNYYRLLNKTVHIGDGSLLMTYDGEGVYYFRFVKVIEIQ